MVDFSSGATSVRLKTNKNEQRNKNKSIKNTKMEKTLD